MYSNCFASGETATLRTAGMRANASMGGGAALAVPNHSANKAGNSPRARLEMARYIRIPCSFLVQAAAPRQRCDASTVGDFVAGVEVDPNRGQAIDGSAR